MTSQSSPTETAVSSGCVPQKLRLEWEVYEGNLASVGNTVSGPGQTTCKNGVQGGIYPPKPNTSVSKITEVNKLKALLDLSCLFLESTYWAANVLAVKTRGWEFIPPSLSLAMKLQSILPTLTVLLLLLSLPGRITEVNLV